MCTDEDAWAVRQRALEAAAAELSARQAAGAGGAGSVRFWTDYLKARTSIPA